MPQWTGQNARIDYPCLGNHHRPPQSPNVQFVYYISFFPSYAQGGGIYARGESNNLDDVPVVIPPKIDFRPWYGKIEVERWANRMVVNDIYIEDWGSVWDRQVLSSNPWLFQAAFFYFQAPEFRENSRGNDYMYIEGEIIDGWLPNPLGLLLFFGGVILLQLSLKVPIWIDSWLQQWIWIPGIGAFFLQIVGGSILVVLAKMLFTHQLIDTAGYLLFRSGEGAYRISWALLIGLLLFYVGRLLYRHYIEPRFPLLGWIISMIVFLWGWLLVWGAQHLNIEK